MDLIKYLITFFLKLGKFIKPMINKVSVEPVKNRDLEENNKEINSKPACHVNLEPPLQPNSYNI